MSKVTPIRKNPKDDLLDIAQSLPPDIDQYVLIYMHKGLLRRQWHASPSTLSMGAVGLIKDAAASEDDDDE